MEALKLLSPEVSLIFSKEITHLLERDGHKTRNITHPGVSQYTVAKYLCPAFAFMFIKKTSRSFPKEFKSFILRVAVAHTCTTELMQCLDF